jgi:NADPH-dependent ferric siderophore reductase
MVARPARGAADEYVPRAGSRVARSSLREALPPERRPVTRTYTVRRVEPDEQQLTLDSAVIGPMYERMAAWMPDSGCAPSWSP